MKIVKKLLSFVCLSSMSFLILGNVAMAGSLYKFTLLESSGISTKDISLSAGESINGTLTIIPIDYSEDEVLFD